LYLLERVCQKRRDRDEYEDADHVSPQRSRRVTKDCVLTDGPPRFGDVTLAAHAPDLRFAGRARNVIVFITSY